MRQSFVFSLTVLVLILAPSAARGSGPCAQETEAFETARSNQVAASRIVSSLEERLRNELSSVSDIRVYYDRRKARLRYLRAKAIADAAVASTACALYSPSACSRLSFLSRRISRLSTEIVLLPSQERAAISRRNQKVARLYSDIARAEHELGLANSVYIDTLLELNRCNGF